MLALAFSHVLCAVVNVHGGLVTSHGVYLPPGSTSGPTIAATQGFEPIASDTIPAPPPGCRPRRIPLLLISSDTSAAHPAARFAELCFREHGTPVLLECVDGPPVWRDAFVERTWAFGLSEHRAIVRS